MKKLFPKPDDAQLAAYLLGELPPKEALAVEQYAAIDPLFAQRLEGHRQSMSEKTLRNQITPPAAAKAKLFQRLEMQEQPSDKQFPPFIHSKTTPSDFNPWIKEAYSKLQASPEDFDSIPIGASEDTFTFLAKMCSSLPEEIHTTEIERVMVLEGHCNFIVGGQAKSFGPGDRYTLPLHVPHSAHVTTAQPCIFIVQRTVIGV